MTDKIRAWLADAGRFLELDAVSLRRALVDEGFLERDPAGKRYRPCLAYRRWVRFGAGAESLDAARIAAEERERIEERRRRHAGG